jgi:hypothetical protein
VKSLFAKNLNYTRQGLKFRSEVQEVAEMLAQKIEERGYDPHHAAEVLSLEVLTAYKAIADSKKGS